MSNINAKVKLSVVQFMGMAGHKYSNNNPIQLSPGPGNTGKILPIMPVNRQMNANKSSNKSIQKRYLGFKYPESLVNL